MNETSPEIIRRRDAVADLGAAVRGVLVALNVSETPVDNLVRAAALAAELEALVAVNPRALTEVASVDSLPQAIRYYSPVIGLGNPMSPPVSFELDESGPAGADPERPEIIGRVTLDRRFEGPPGFVHGGVTSMLLDEVLGRAGTQSGHWGMTAYLNVTYRRALPLDVPLEIRSRLESVDGRKVRITGSIALESRPESLCVEAEGLFIAPRAERHTEYFGALHDLDGNPQSGRHGGFAPLPTS